MQLSNDQIVNILLAHYKRTGSDLSGIARDPVFNTLPINVKIQTLKDHADDIHASIKPGLNSADYTHAAIDAGFTGIGSALATGALIHKSGIVGSMTGKSLAEVMAHNKAMRNVAIFSGVTSGLLAGGISLMERKTESDLRARNQRIVDSLKNNPTSERATVALSLLQRGMRPGASSQIAERAGELAMARLQASNENTLPNLYVDRIQHYTNS
jgi:hypothetical protein